MVVLKGWLLCVPMEIFPRMVFVSWAARMRSFARIVPNVTLCLFRFPGCHRQSVCNLTLSEITTAIVGVLALGSSVAHWCAHCLQLKEARYNNIALCYSLCSVAPESSQSGKCRQFLALGPVVPLWNGCVLKAMHCAAGTCILTDNP